MSQPKQRRSVVMGVAALAVGASLLTGCQGGTSGANTAAVQPADDGSTVTMWTRSSTSTFTTALVDAYNASHKNKVKLTVIPFDAYQQKVASAAGAGQLPDIVSSDVVYTPSYVDKGLFKDITGEVNSLPFKDKLAPGQMSVGEKDGKNYAVPHDLDLSAMFYNKVLFKKAGLDPNTPPTTLTGWLDAAKKINALGGGINGFYFGGNCGGCMLFTTWPSIWAGGGKVLDDAGSTSVLDSSQASDVYKLYRQAWADGLTPQGAQTETGATFTQVFATGNIGMQILGATSYGSYKPSSTLDVGVAPVPGVNGGESTFLGGDTLSIAANSKNAAAAWDFLSWTLGDTAQLDVVAKSGQLSARTDLADNQYSKADPNVATLAGLVSKGQTPKSINFGSVYNDANGPWNTYYRDLIFGDASKQKNDNDSITSALKNGH